MELSQFCCEPHFFKPTQTADVSLANATVKKATPPKRSRKARWKIAGNHLWDCLQPFFFVKRKDTSYHLAALREKE